MLSAYFRVFSNMYFIRKERCLGHRFGPKIKEIRLFSRINWGKYRANQSKSEEIIEFF